MSLKSNKMIFNTDMKRKSSGKKPNARYTKTVTPTVAGNDIPDFVDELFDESQFDAQDEFSK